ncbi:hypothetical protein OE766_28470 [Pararhizobium sp. YC-54]|uniref:Rid family hydrolase n=1 Tax=Pararhizobium sp. YC-54 TaxID=2986920 RepID=UPI0021F6CD0F|nr:Rid family hydrolase [Pararhizobium sp. YC-54]MCW0002135.1 hypothetical protein [Pararhizobium sp. YC-54]
MARENWRLPVSHAHHLSASAGKLSFVGGAGDFDGAGRIRAPGNFELQVEGSISNLVYALAAESCTLDDVVRLKVHHTSECDDWDVIAALSQYLEAEPLPAISVVPEPFQPFSNQMVQIQAIAQRGWRALSDVRIVTRPVPASKASLFNGRAITAGLRAGEFIAVSNRSSEDEDGVLQHADDGVLQSHSIMQIHEQTLKSLGASFQDCVKLEAYYFGDDLEDWAPLAKARLSYFREPGPVATVVPAHRLNPENAVTKIEMLAMRELRNGYSKYIPREDHWPERVWDWPVEAPYRQAIGLRNTIWLGGQVPWNSYTNAGVWVFPGDLLAQTRFTMTYIEDLLLPFGRRLTDLKNLICYFATTGTEEETIAFVGTIADCFGGALPPMTLVPKPKMHDSENMVEIWGVAQN